VLHPLRFGDEFDTAVWKHTAKLVRRTLWRLESPFAEPAGWEIKRIAADDLTALASVLPRGAATLGAFERSEGLFRHMLHCPIVPMELYALKSQNQVRGYFLLAFATGQARIADCWAATEEPAAWQALIQYAALQAWRHRNIAEITAWSSDALMTRALVATGFHHRSQQPIMLRFATQDQAVAERFRVQMLDNDAAYLHHRVAQWWA
jgi:predicted acetyltransferase